MVETVVDSYPKSNQDNVFYIYGASYHTYGQSFIGNGGSLSSAILFGGVVGTPTGSITAFIYPHVGVYGTSGKGSGVPLATSVESIDVSTLPVFSVPQDAGSLIYTFSGTNQITLVSGTPYYLVARYAGGNSTNKVGMADDSIDATHAGNASAKFSSTWYVFATRDCIFSVSTSTSDASSTIPQHLTCWDI